MVQNKNDTNYQEKFMRKILFCSFFIIFALSGLIFTGTAQSRMKCWINNDEVKECGNRVPPEYAQNLYNSCKQEGSEANIDPDTKAPRPIPISRATRVVPIPNAILP